MTLWLYLWFGLRIAVTILIKFFIMVNNFTPGDIVTLKSDGPVMTIAKIVDSICTCYYQDKKCIVRSVRLPIEVLKVPNELPENETEKLLPGFMTSKPEDIEVVDK